jgi:hypothetical protein
MPLNHDENPPRTAVPEMKRKSVLNENAPAAVLSDPRPVPLRRDVKLACQGVTVTALSISVELNVYDHVKYAHMPAVIGWSIGVAVPFVIAFLSHVAAHVNFHPAAKFWVGLIVTVLMYVSAAAGVSVLRPGMGFLPALGTAAGMDAAALTALGFLMFNTSVVAALTAWQDREQQRLRQEQAAQVAARYSTRQQAGNSTGNSTSNRAGNTIPAVTGNTPAAAPPVTGPAPQVTPAGTAPTPVTAGGGEGDTGEAAQGSYPGAQVIGLTPVPTEQEMRALARHLYDTTGNLSVRAYRGAGYRGSQKAVMAAVAAVKAELGLADDDTAAAGAR